MPNPFKPVMTAVRRVAAAVSGNKVTQLAAGEAGTVIEEIERLTASAGEGAGGEPRKFTFNRKEGTLADRNPSVGRVNKDGSAPEL